MKIILLFATLLAISCKPIECDKFKVGTFKNYENGEWTKTIVTRTDEFQIEYNEETKEESKDKIVWINECTYRLTSIIYKNKPALKNMPDLIVKITDVGEDYFKIEAAEEGKESTYWSKMVRIY